MAGKRMTVVRNGRVLDIKGHCAPHADILIEGDSIAGVGAPGLAAPADAVVVDASDRLIHPGLINAHTHGHGNLSKGMGDRFTLEGLNYKGISLELEVVGVGEGREGSLVGALLGLGLGQMLLRLGRDRRLLAPRPRRRDAARSLGPLGRRCALRRARPRPR